MGKAYMKFGGWLIEKYEHDDNQKDGDNNSFYRLSY